MIPGFHPCSLATLALPLASWHERAGSWWRDAKMWTLMYRGSLLVGGIALVAFVLWRIVAARRERSRLEALVASRTRQLRQSEELFRSIFEHATEGVFQSSLDGRNLRANPAMARICGYASAEEMQERLTDAATQFYVRPERRAEIQALVARDGIVTDLESEIRRQDGSTVWISENVRTVVDPDTGRTVYQGSIVDVTERKAMRQAQEQARAAAEAANRAKSTFLAQITHELRTPLTGILGSARVALRDTGLDPRNRERFSLVVSSGEHLLGLIDELLDLSRIEAGRLEPHPAPFDLSELLRSIGSDFGMRAATEAKLEFRSEIDPSLPLFVHGDARRLRQVLVNLLSNAFKFTDRGLVTLRVARCGDAMAHFEVLDTGIGIPVEARAAIFEPFHQVHSPDRPNTGGVGLGLHISTRLVGCLGGRLQVESEPGRGSRFWFAVPLPAADDGTTLGKATVVPAGTALLPVPAVPAFPSIPSVVEIDSLLDLSLGGDIVRLRERLVTLRTAEPDYGPFIVELERLAGGFQMDAITRFLRRARERGDDRANVRGVDESFSARLLP